MKTNCLKIRAFKNDGTPLTAQQFRAVLVATLMSDYEHEDDGEEFIIMRGAIFEVIKGDDNV